MSILSRACAFLGHDWRFWHVWDGAKCTHAAKCKTCGESKETTNAYAPPPSTNMQAFQRVMQETWEECVNARTL